MLDTSDALKNPLVVKYLDAQKKAVEQVDRGIESVGREGLKKFSENCRVWLSGIWDEIEPGEYHFIREGKDPYLQSITFIFHFTWLGVNGTIASCGWGKVSKITNPWATLIFKFEASDINIRLQHDFLPTDTMKYTEEARAVDDFELGATLYRVAVRIGEAAEKQKKNLEVERKYKLDQMERGFERVQSEDELRLYSAECRSKAPNEWLRWDKAAGQAYKRIREKAAEERHKKEEQARWQAEEDRLEQLASEGFIRINVFEITCAVMPPVPDNAAALPPASELVVERVFYTLCHQPDTDGWFTEIHGGKERKVRLNNILAVALISIDGPGHELVSRLYRRVTLQSPRFDDLTAIFWALPGQEVPRP